MNDSNEGNTTASQVSTEELLSTTKDNLQRARREITRLQLVADDAVERLDRSTNLLNMQERLTQTIQDDLRSTTLKLEEKRSQLLITEVERDEQIELNKRLKDRLEEAQTKLQITDFELDEQQERNKSLSDKLQVALQEITEQERQLQQQHFDVVSELQGQLQESRIQHEASLLQILAVVHNQLETISQTQSTGQTTSSAEVPNEHGRK